MSLFQGGVLSPLIQNILINDVPQYYWRHDNNISHVWEKVLNPIIDICSIYKGDFWVHLIIGVTVSLRMRSYIFPQTYIPAVYRRKEASISFLLTDIKSLKIVRPLLLKLRKLSDALIELLTVYCLVQNA